MPSVSSVLGSSRKINPCCRGAHGGVRGGGAGCGGDTDWPAHVMGGATRKHWLPLRIADRGERLDGGFLRKRGGVCG